MIRTTSISKLKPPILDIYEIIKQQFIKRSEKQLGLLSFFARVYPNDKCGSNGLPLTPNSIRIYGKFQRLKSIKYKFLCRYIDIQRGNHERLFIISEHYSLCLNDLLNDTYIYNLIIANVNILMKWFYQILLAFNYLSCNSIVHRYLSLRYTCVTASGNIKLNNSKTDVWSYGIILFQFLFGVSNQKEFDCLLTPERIIENALNLVQEAYSNDDEKLSSAGYEYILKLYGIDSAKQNQIEKEMPFAITPAKTKIEGHGLSTFGRMCSKSKETCINLINFCVF